MYATYYNNSYSQCSNESLFSGHDIKSQRDVTFEIVKQGNIYTAYLNDQEIGKATVTNRSKEAILRINRMDNLSQNITGVGTALLQAIISDSIRQGYGGKVELVALPSALGFYWKMGLRVALCQNNFRRTKSISLESLEARMLYHNWTLESPEVKNNETYQDVRRILARRLNKAEHEVDVFNEYRNRHWYKLSDKINKRVQKAKALNQLPDTASLPGTMMYLPAASIETWKQIIQNPETKKANLPKLLEVKQLR